MGIHFQPPAIAEAMDAIEAQVLPSITDILDGLLEASAMARCNVSHEAQGAELRRVVRELEQVTRQMESLAALRPHDQASAEAARMSA